jgi:hypothetical protein
MCAATCTASRSSSPRKAPSSAWFAPSTSRCAAAWGGGGVRGSIRAVSVKLQASAQVEGDITHQKLSIAEGAEFDGRVKLTKDASELMPELDPEAIERTRNNGDASRYETSGHLGERAD